jgi:hypothetical protein
LLSASGLAGTFACVLLWFFLAQRLTADDLFAIGTPAELHGGALVVILTLIGAVWLLLTSCAARGAALRQRDRRIAELEAKLSELSNS